MLLEFLFLPHLYSEAAWYNDVYVAVHFQESKKHLGGLSALGIGCMVKEITTDDNYDTPSEKEDVSETGE